MTAATDNITVEQGGTFSRVVTVNESGSPKNLTGYAVRAQIRKTATSSAILQAITCTITDAANGEVTLNITATDTATLTPGRAVWDLEIDDQGSTPVVTPLLRGNVTILPNVTR